MIAVKVEPQSLARIKDTLLDAATELKTTNRYEVFRFRINSGVIVAYTSGKIVANNDESYELLKRVLGSAETLEDEIAIGSDETGKGEWLGPLVVSAVAVSPDAMAEFRSIGVMDSKELTTKRIEQIAPQIKKLALGFKVIVIQPKRFNDLFDQFKKEGKGLNGMLAWAHTEAIKNVYAEIRPKAKVRITIDEFDRIKTEERLGELKEMPNVTIVQKPRAEEDISVACASILAKAERERWITEKSKMLNVNLRKIKEKDALTMDEREELFKASYLKDRDN
jgi:ribonuclease HIII